MDDGGQSDKEEWDKGQEEEANSLDWLLRNNSSDMVAVPMDTNIPLSSSFVGEDSSSTDGISSDTFTKEEVFKASSQGHAPQLRRLLPYLQQHNKKLTSPEFIDEGNGKTALLKALLNMKDGKKDTIEVLLDIAEKTDDLKNLINSSYTDPFYRGQSALHVAIERRRLDLVELLVQKGADVQAKADGTFFQRNEGVGFYFGELPLSLAACTNQLDIVSFLMENPYSRADVTAKDSQGNTVLHILVIIADNSEENTDIFANVYDKILIQHSKLRKKEEDQLEELKNKQGLTPLKLAAKLGKIGLFKHILDREFKEEGTKPLSRKWTEWVYGPVRSSLHDITSIDTNEDNSVLEIIVLGSEIPNRPEMLQLEPLRSLLEEKWDRFASKMFLMHFLVYVTYLAIFTAVAFNRKDGQPPFPVENVPIDHVRCVGEIISVLGAVWILYKSITTFKRNPPNFKALFIDGFSEILFFLQAALLLICAVLYFCGWREYVGLLVLSLTLAWMNVLYYSRGYKQMGIYNVTMQRMILSDLLHFLCVYSVLLFGFSVAIVALMDNTRRRPTNSTEPQGGRLGVEPAPCSTPSYNNIRFTILALFKFTIGMGDLEFTDHVQYKEFFYILLITYIVLTYILLLNMLIALMGNTVERTSKQSEDIWNLQRAFTILEMERMLPRTLRTHLDSKKSKRLCFTNEADRDRRFLRVEEMNWTQWRSEIGLIQEEEDPGTLTTSPQHGDNARPGTGSQWNLNQLLERIHARRRRPRQQPSVP